MSSRRSVSSFPNRGEPDSPIFFRIEISPPLSLISREAIAKIFPSLLRDVESLCCRAALRVPPQPFPKLPKPGGYLLFDRRQLGRRKFGTIRRPVLSKEVVLDFGLGAGTAHRDSRPVFQ